VAAGDHALPPADRLHTVKLCLIGFGSVARALCELLAQQERALAGRGLRLLVSGAGTRHGSFVEPAGVPAGELLARASAGLASPARPAYDLLIASQADILVELTVMEGHGAPEATGHIETAFAVGMDVVTANKGPIAWNWSSLARQARRAGRRLRFESTVMDGLPVFSLLQFALPDCRLLGFDAVFNSTTNTIIDALGAGRTFDEALAQAQAAGYAEADPSNDIDGWDAAYKAAVLANVAMGASITPADIVRQSLRDVPIERIAQARASGARLRLVTSVWREPAAAGAVQGCVAATELTVDHPLASLGGESLGAVLHTDLMGDVVVAELGALVPQTAYGVYADLLWIAGSRR
jgi:homoserine dehydrogenase